MFNGVDLLSNSCCNVLLADEGGKMCFRLRSGVKYEDRDLVKLT